MMRRRTFLLAAAMLGLAAPACNDGKLTRPLLRSIPGLFEVQATPLHLEITSLIETLFPKGLETAAGTRWDGIAEKVADGQLTEAKSKLVELSKWVKSKVPQMETSAERTREQNERDAARLIFFMWLYVHESPNAEPPPIATGGDVAVAIVEPAVTTTLTTEPEADGGSEAGVQLEAGSVNTTSVLIISENPNEFPKHCAGPLDTKRCQYPLFYRFDLIPREKLNKPARIVVCHAHGENNRRLLKRPEDEHFHDRLRLAHTRPDDPANFTTDPEEFPDNFVDGIEFLPRRLVALTFMKCPEGGEGEEAPGFKASLNRSTSNASRAMIDQGWEHEGRFLSGRSADSELSMAPLGALASRSAAMTEVQEFNNFNDVDPDGMPDLSAEQLSTSPEPVIAGGSVSLSYTIANRSPLTAVGEGRYGVATAASEATVVDAYLSSDAILDLGPEGDVLLQGSHPTGYPIGGLAPDDVAAVGVASPLPHTVIIPLSFEVPNTPTVYHLFVRARPVGAPALTEATLANNYTSVAITVNPRAVDPTGGCTNGSETDCNPEGATLNPAAAFVDPTPPAGYTQCAGFINTELDDVRWDWENNCAEFKTGPLYIRVYDDASGRVLAGARIFNGIPLTWALTTGFNYSTDSFEGEGLLDNPFASNGLPGGVSLAFFTSDGSFCGCPRPPEGQGTCNDIFTANAANDKILYVGGNSTNHDYEAVWGPAAEGDTFIGKNTCSLNLNTRIIRLRVAIYALTSTPNPSKSPVGPSLRSASPATTRANGCTPTPAGLVGAARTLREDEVACNP